MTSAPAASLRKGARTQARLIEATIDVLGRLGYAATSVLEITKAAKVSNATFYLYFDNKDHVIDVAIFKVTADMMWKIHTDELKIPDMVERSAYAIRRFISVLLEDPAWARAMMATYEALPRLRSVMNRYSVQTLHEGIARGAFRIEGTPLQAECMNAVAMTAVRMHLESQSGPNTIEACIVLILRMLGASPPQGGAASSGAAATSHATD